MGGSTMVQLRERADSVPMSKETRGHSIKARRLALGIKSVRELAKESGLAREAVTAAEAGTASVGTYDRLEAWLDAFEEEAGVDEVPDPRVVTFRLSGNFGVDVALSGPVDNLAELEATVQRLIRGMEEAPKTDESQSDN